MIPGPTRLYPWVTIRNEQLSPDHTEGVELMQYVLERYDAKLREIASWKSPVGIAVARFLRELELEVQEITGVSRGDS